MRLLGVMGSWMRARMRWGRECVREGGAEGGAVSGEVHVNSDLPAYMQMNTISISNSSGYCNVERVGLGWDER